MLTQFLSLLATIISVISLLIVTYGALIAILSFILNELKRITGTYTPTNIRKLRAVFGTYLLLGLEFLIASDILKTVLEPTMKAPLLEGFGGHALAAGFTIREENIPAFAAAMNDYVCACTGGEEMVSALDIDGELDDVGLLTLEGVEGLELLEPYGAGNPKPVFSLSGCLVSAVNEVGGGRHLKLKLTASGRSFDAIFFSATAEEAGVGPGDRVDVAFTPQINEYRGWRSVQLQLCDLRPALTRAQAERALYEKFRRGEPLTRQEAEALLPSREEFVTLWRYLKGHAGQAPLEATAHRLARSIARSAGRRETVMRTLVCLEVFDERGLIRLEHTTDHLHIALRSVDGKVNLDDSCIMRKLRHILSNG